MQKTKLSFRNVSRSAAVAMLLASSFASHAAVLTADRRPPARRPPF